MDSCCRIQVNNSKFCGLRLNYQALILAKMLEDCFSERLPIVDKADDGYISENGSTEAIVKDGNEFGAKLFPRMSVAGR